MGHATTVDVQSIAQIGIGQQRTHRIVCQLQNKRQGHIVQGLGGRAGDAARHVGDLNRAVFDAEIGEDLRPDTDIALRVALAVAAVRRRTPGDQHDDACAMFAHRLHRALQRALARTGLAEHIVEDRNRVNAGKGGLVLDHMALLQDVAFAAVDSVAVGQQTPVAAIVGIETVLGDALDQTESVIAR